MTKLYSLHSEWSRISIIYYGLLFHRRNNKVSTIELMFWMIVSRPTIRLFMQPLDMWWVHYSWHKKLGAEAFTCHDECSMTNSMILNRFQSLMVGRKKCRVEKSYVRFNSTSIVERVTCGRRFKSCWILGWYSEFLIKFNTCFSTIFLSKGDIWTEKFT